MAWSDSGLTPGKTSCEFPVWDSGEEGRYIQYPMGSLVIMNGSPPHKDIFHSRNTPITVVIQYRKKLK
jgi:hypothetical protein